jgi:hypothetical protein
VYRAVRARPQALDKCRAADDTQVVHPACSASEGAVSLIHNAINSSKVQSSVLITESSFSQRAKDRMLATRSRPALKLREGSGKQRLDEKLKSSPRQAPRSSLAARVADALQLPYPNYTTSTPRPPIRSASKNFSRSPLRPYATPKIEYHELCSPFAPSGHRLLPAHSLPLPQELWRACS